MYCMKKEAVILPQSSSMAINLNMVAREKPGRRFGVDTVSKLAQVEFDVINVLTKGSSIKLLMLSCKGFLANSIP